MRLLAAIMTSGFLVAAFGVASADAAAHRAAAMRRCVVADLRLRVIVQFPAETGQNPVPIRVTNGSSSACALGGYARPIFYALRDRELPFVVKDAGNGEVTAARPTPTTLRASGSAFVLLSKYRCDLKDRGVATTLRLSLTGQGGVLRLAIAQEHIAYCGLGDPGSRVYVSPVERTLVATTVFG